MTRVARLVVASIAMSWAGVALSQARPVIIEESAVITPPPGIDYEWFGSEVGTNGEFALVAAARPSPPGEYFIQDYDALLYRRIGNNWVFQRFLAQGSHDPGDDRYFPVIVGMKDNIATAELSGSFKVFYFNGTDWIDQNQPGGLYDDVAIDGSRALFGVGGWDGYLLERGSSGTWTSTSLPGQTRCCDDEFWGGPVDVLGERVILGTPYPWLDDIQEIPLYQRNGSAGWQLRTKIQIPEGEFRLGEAVALHGENAIVAARGAGGPFVWNSSDNFSVPTGRVQTTNAYARGTDTRRFAKDRNLLLVSANDPDLGRIVVNVFRADSAGRYQHVAILKPKDATVLNGSIEIDGNTVIAGSDTRALVFTLPASFTPSTPRYDRFEGGNGANWTPAAGSQFTVVRPTKFNGVYRQSSTAGDARSVFNDTSAVNQAIEADVRPTAFNGNDRWVGLATRYANDQNYYYVTLRSSGSVQLKRMRDGAYTTLASAPLTVQTNRTYRVRLESLGSLHRVYVDGALLLSADDAGPQVAGNAAVMMYRAAADFDNVIVSPSRRSTLFADDFNADYNRGDWSYNGSGQWSIAGNAFVQSSVAAEARAIIGISATDQIVSAKVRPVAFSTASSSERWAGLLARYVDERNYYYLTLRSGNTLSVRRLVNGAITELGSVPVTVTPGTTYSLRLEALVTTLRVYLNDTLVMQVLDDSHLKGRTGLMTNRASAQFDDYVAYQP